MRRSSRRGVAEDPTTGRRRRRLAGSVLVALLALLGALYAAGYAFAGERVPRGVAVAGVDIGGLRPGAARETLRRELAPRADDPIEVRAGGRTYPVDPGDAGLALDVPATVAAAGGGRTYNPLRMLEVLTGGDDVQPVLDADAGALRTAVDELADKVAREPVQASIDFVRGRAEPTYPEPGRRLDQAAARQALQEAFLAPDAAVDAPTRPVRPALTDADVDAAMSRFAEPAMSAPVTVRGAGRTTEISPARLSGALSMRPRDGELVPRLDPQKLQKRARKALGRITRAPEPATVALRGGSPKVLPGEPGTAVNTSRLARKILGALTERGDARTVTIKPRRVQPAFGARDARKLGIREVVSEFTTYFPHSDYRNTNLGQAARNINGTVLKPGETFSFNDTVGERTAENGFTQGYIISNGVLVEDYGGGVSQVATTTYNAAFFAGLTDVEHHPHSLYFDRYPMGREATVAWGALDLRFRNDTPHGVLIQAWIEPSTPSSEGAMHVRMWSTKYWNIKAGLSEQYDFTLPETIHRTGEDCVEQDGFAGFEVDVYRYFRRGGERVRTEKDHVVYDAADTIVCSPPPS